MDYIDVSQCDSYDSISRAAIDFLQKQGITIPSPVKLTPSENRRAGTGFGSKIFGIPLVELQSRDVPAGGEGKVPLFVENCLTYLRDHIATEGLFRKTGSVARQREMRMTLEEGGAFPKLRPHDVANLFKLFLRELPEPLMTRRFGQVFADCHDQKERSTELTLTSCLLLPLPHIQCLQVLMQFLHEVSQHSATNKMDVCSLAVVLTPNLFQMVATGDKHSSHSQGSLSRYTKTVELLIANSDRIGLVSSRLIADAQLLIEKTDGLLEPLPLTIQIEHLSRSKTRGRRMRGKSGSFGDLMRGLGNSITRLRKTSPSRKIDSSSSFQTPLHLPCCHVTGSDVTTAKDSCDRHVDIKSTGTKAKRRAVYESPEDDIVTPKSKKKPSIFRRKAFTEKAKRNKKFSSLSITSSQEQLVKQQSAVSTKPVQLALPEISAVTTEKQEITLAFEDSASDSLPPTGVDGSEGSSLKSSNSLYEMVTSNGTLVKCLREDPSTNSKNIKYSAVTIQRRRASSTSTEDPLAPSVTQATLSHGEKETFKNNSCHSNMYSKHLQGKDFRNLTLLPSKSAKSFTKSHSAFEFGTITPYSSKGDFNFRSHFKGESPFLSLPQAGEYTDQCTPVRPPKASQSNHTMDSNLESESEEVTPVIPLKQICMIPVSASEEKLMSASSLKTKRKRNSPSIGSLRDRRRSNRVIRRGSHPARKPSLDRQTLAKPDSFSKTQKPVVSPKACCPQEKNDGNDFSFSIPLKKSTDLDLMGPKFTPTILATIADLTLKQRHSSEEKSSFAFTAPEPRDIDNIPICTPANLRNSGSTKECDGMEDSEVQEDFRSSLSHDDIGLPHPPPSTPPSDLLLEISQELLQRKLSTTNKDGLLSTLDKEPMPPSKKDDVGGNPKGKSGCHNMSFQKAIGTFSPSYIDQSNPKKNYFKKSGTWFPSLEPTPQKGKTPSCTSSCESLSDACGSGVSGRSPVGAIKKISGLSPKMFMKNQMKKISGPFFKTPAEGSGRKPLLPKENKCTSTRKATEIRQISKEWIV